MFQVVRFIDYYQNSQKPLNHYIETLQTRGYVYETDWLPHDARAKQLGVKVLSEEDFDALLAAG